MKIERITFIGDSLLLWGKRISTFNRIKKDPKLSVCQTSTRLYFIFYFLFYFSYYCKVFFSNRLRILHVYIWRVFVPTNQPSQVEGTHSLSVECGKLRLMSFSNFQSIWEVGELMQPDGSNKSFWDIYISLNVSFSFSTGLLIIDLFTIGSENLSLRKI